MAKQLQSYRSIIGDKAVETILDKSRHLSGKRILHVNSTRSGGGVAEILQQLVALMQSLGIDAEWRILAGKEPFFKVTKKIHNSLQGQAGTLSDWEKEIYHQTNSYYADFSPINHDIVIIHDPQPLPQVHLHEKTQPWIWRCHIDLTRPNPDFWEHLRPFVAEYDRMIVSTPEYRKADVDVEQHVFQPAIDPLSDKNRELSGRQITSLFQKYQIPRDKPLITQVSRFDPWKDPRGVLEVYKKVKATCDARMLFCFNSADDDPEGVRVYEEMCHLAADEIASGDVLFVRGDDPLLVNALQRESSVILQKSKREGFGLTVSEAMWKGTPVVASRVGGIPLQIKDGVSGYLVGPQDIDAAANRVTTLLSHPKKAGIIGRNAKERVREHFLITRLLSDYIDLFTEVLESKQYQPTGTRATALAGMVINAL
ncbi:MAG: glycosyltransferase [candidate division KSB1 bacterium]|nr:glycosyltransferase [candidate division KSB1 bacterium]